MHVQTLLCLLLLLSLWPASVSSLYRNSSEVLSIFFPKYSHVSTVIMNSGVLPCHLNKYTLLYLSSLSPNSGIFFTNLFLCVSFNRNFSGMVTFTKKSALFHVKSISSIFVRVSSVSVNSGSLLTNLFLCASFNVNSSGMLTIIKNPSYSLLKPSLLFFILSFLDIFFTQPLCCYYHLHFNVYHFNCSFL